MYIDEVPFVWSVCLCVCPHIFCIFSTRILILLAKLGHVCKVEPFSWAQLQRQTHPWNLTKGGKQEIKSILSEVSHQSSSICFWPPQSTYLTPLLAIVVLWQNNTPDFQRWANCKMYYINMLSALMGTRMEHKGTIFWGSVLGLWLVVNAANTFFYLQLKTAEYSQV